MAFQTKSQYIDRWGNITSINNVTFQLPANRYVAMPDPDRPHILKLTVQSTAELTAPQVTQQPSGNVVQEGEVFVLSAQAEGTPFPNAQWQVRIPNGNWQDISGATGYSYTFIADDLQSGNRYRCHFTNIVGETYTDEAVLTVIPPLGGRPIIDFQPGSQTVAPGVPAAFSATATGDPTPSAIWQVNDGTGWVTAPIAQELSAPVVTLNPTSKSVTVGANTTFSATAQANPTATIQWQINIGSGWNNIMGATTSVYTVPSPQVGDTGKKYRAIFTNSQGTATTTEATLTVTSGGGGGGDTAPAFFYQQPSAQNGFVEGDVNGYLTMGYTGTPTPTVLIEKLPAGQSTGSWTTLNWTVSNPMIDGSGRIIFVIPTSNWPGVTSSEGFVTLRMKLTNSAGTVTSNDIRLQVYGVP